MCERGERDARIHRNTHTEGGGGRELNWHNLCIKTIRECFVCDSNNNKINIFFHSISRSSALCAPKYSNNKHRKVYFAACKKKYIQANNAWKLSYLMSEVCNNEKNLTTINFQCARIHTNDCRRLLSIIIITILIAFKACTEREWKSRDFFSFFVWI